MNKKIIWVLIILIVVGSGYYLFNMKSYNLDKDDYNSSQEMNSASSTEAQSDSSNTPVATSTKVSTAPASTGSKTFTLADVSTHASNASCWSAISGKVYDLTSWIGKHPGGDEAILAICGKDGTKLFDGEHGMDPKAKGVLPKFYLGDLAN